MLVNFCEWTSVFLTFSFERPGPPKRRIHLCSMNLMLGSNKTTRISIQESTCSFVLPATDSSESAAEDALPESLSRPRRESVGNILSTSR